MGSDDVEINILTLVGLQWFRHLGLLINVVSIRDR